jgi:hypothetical protein
VCVFVSNDLDHFRFEVGEGKVETFWSAIYAPFGIGLSYSMVWGIGFRCSRQGTEK